MTEQEYCDLTDRVKLSNALSLLGSICPDCSKIIDKKEFQKVCKTLREWEIKLFEIDMIDDEGN